MYKKNTTDLTRPHTTGPSSCKCRGDKPTSDSLGEAWRACLDENIHNILWALGGVR